MQQDEDMLLQSIYEEYQGTLRRIARALNVPNMELEDVVQETFIAYFRKYSLTWSPTRKKAMLVKILKGKRLIVSERMDAMKRSVLMRKIR